MTNKTWSSRHLPPDTELNQEGNLPELDLSPFFQNEIPPEAYTDFETNPLAELFHKIPLQSGKTVESDKSTMLFPYWVRPPHGGETVGDEEDGALAAPLGEIREGAHLGLRVEGGGGLVQHQDVGTRP